MPLIRLEVRDKSTTGGAPGAPRKAPAGTGKSTGRSATPALVAGALVGLLAIAAFSGYLIAQKRQPAAASVAPGAGAPAAAGGSLQVADVPPLNKDYARNAIIAYVDGKPYTMAELETAVRIARVLGSFSGDKVPGDGDPALHDFQIAMLKREIDGVLLRQALARSGLPPINADVNAVIDAYLQKFTSTRDELNSRMAANGVTQQQLTDWFAASRDSQYFIQQKLMTNKQPLDMPQVVKAWLDDQWKTQDIQVNFYDPSTSVPPAGGAAPTP